MVDGFILRNSFCISPKTCQDLINFFDENEDHAYKGGAGNILLDDLELDINVYQFNDDLSNGINNTIEKYKQRFPLINDVLESWHVDPFAQLMRYEPGAVYDKTHCETSVEYPYRIFAWMIYLNTIEEGGATEFLHQHETTIPRAGDMYIWPAGWTHMHRGVVAPNERKYLLTGWVSHLV